MILCPRRRSGIAILRCAEYQSRDGCQVGCVSAASREQIDFVTALSSAEEAPLQRARRNRRARKNNAAHSQSRRSKERTTHMSKNDHVKWLKDQLAQHERDLAHAESNVERLKSTVRNLRGTVEILTAPGEGNGIKNKTSGSVSTSIAVRTLKRNPKYEPLSTIAAVKEILSASPEPIQQDELTRSIFQITDKSDLARARQSLSSQLRAGAKKRYWKALGDGLYGKAEG